MGISDSFIASIAHCLNSAQIPCVLWDECLMDLHGAPLVVSSVDFIVPDDRLADGLQALSQHESLIPCPDVNLKSCKFNLPDRQTPVPAAHVHIKASDVMVGLYRQADTIGFLPPLDASLVFPKKSELPPHFVLASDDTVLPPERPGRGSGFFKGGGDQVVALKAHVFLEALMRIYARDLGTPSRTFGPSMLVYIWTYIDNDGFLEISELPEPLRALYIDYKKEETWAGPWALELKKALQTL